MRKIKRDVPVIYKRKGKQKIVFGIALCFLIIYALTLLIPMGMIFLNSLKDSLTYNDQLFSGEIYKWPDKVVFSNYSRALSLLSVPTAKGDVKLPEMVWNTLWMATSASFISTFTHLAVAYVCAKYKFRGNAFLQGLALLLMILPVYGTTGASLKLYIALGIYNNPLGIILSAFEGFGMQFFVLMGFFKGISWNYAEAAFIDGGGHFTVFFKIMLPQAVSISLVFFVQTWLGFYSSYENILLFMPDYINIATGLYYEQMLLPRLGETPVYFAALFLSAIPILAIYIAFGKTLMTSMNIGGLKG